MTESTTPTPADIPDRHRRAVVPHIVVELLQPPTDMFHGDRTALLEDPHGHLWVLLTHVEDVSEEEPCSRLAAAG